jgi:UDP-N-acetyl-D-glucosamine dehydrogenase
MSDVDRLLAKLAAGTGRVGVIGLGYVGLPLALEFCRAGVSVLGFDIDPEKVEKLRAGETYISDIPSESIASAVKKGRLDATADPDRLGEPDALCICVPTPLTPTRDPDLSFVVGTVETIAARLRPGQLVVLESTTYPGTTREEVLPRLEATGLRVGVDFCCGYAPERVNPGASDPPFSQVPRVVSGITDACLKATKALYDTIVTRTIPVSSPEVAEMAKLLENIFRATNISMVNELKMICLRMGVDIWEVIKAASTKPFGFMPFQPGPGLGGHCIPIDPFYLSWRARAFGVNARFIELAGEINAQMPDFVVQRIMEALNSQAKPLKGSRILVLGASYKPNVGDVRESPAIRIMELLQRGGAEVRYNDPWVSRIPRMRHSTVSLASVELTEAELRDADCVVIATNHDAYDYDHIVRNAKLIVDTRNATEGVLEGREKVWKA